MANLKDAMKDIARIAHNVLCNEALCEPERDPEPKVEAGTVIERNDKRACVYAVFNGGKTLLVRVFRLSSTAHDFVALWSYGRDERKQVLTAATVEVGDLVVGQNGKRGLVGFIAGNGRIGITCPNEDYFEYERDEVTIITKAKEEG